jgi:hypothetical protein
MKTLRKKYRVSVSDELKDEFIDLMNSFVVFNPRTGKNRAHTIDGWRQTAFANTFRINLADDELIIAKLTKPHFFKPMTDAGRELSKLYL